MPRIVTPITTSAGADKAVYALALGRTIDRMVEEGVPLMEIAETFNEQAVMGFTRKPFAWYPTTMSKLYKKNCGVSALLGDLAIAEIGGYPCVHPALGNTLASAA